RRVGGAGFSGAAGPEHAARAPSEAPRKARRERREETGISAPIIGGVAGRCRTGWWSRYRPGGASPAAAASADRLTCRVVDSWGDVTTRMHLNVLLTDR